MRGRLIVLAGIDGSGKATQAALLLERLAREGREAAAFDFPQYDGGFFGKMVARYLRGEFGAAREVSPYLASLLYAGDRWEARGRIVGALDAGRVVVCNRYVSANMAHQGGKIARADERRAFYDWVAELEFGVFALPPPDLCLLLDVPVALAGALVGRKGRRAYLRGAERDIHEADAGHLAAASEAYREISRLFPNWVRIECAPEGQMLPREEIAARIWAEVAPRLGPAGRPRGGIASLDAER